MTEEANQKIQKNKQILDVCCGSRMFWFDKSNPHTVFMDNRVLHDTLCDGRELDIEPDIVGDYRKYNVEGYADPTAYEGMKEIIREENENDKRAFDLVKMLKYIIKLAGFELIERVQLRDTKSGREYR